ncbi:MAG: NAD-dependent epimerase/dehydratase family protein, partial [Gammaproteobacteria bacterium]
VERILHVSSGSVYGASGEQEAPLDEVLTPLKPEGLYGVSKQAAEAAVLRLGQLHGLDVLVGRLGTCFGPWEFDTGVRDTLSPPLQVVQRMLRGEEVVLPRPGRRDWLYVRDAAAGLVALLDMEKNAGHSPPLYNVAAGFQWSISHWCDAMMQEEPGLRWRFANEGETPNVDYHAPYDRAPMDNRRLLAATGFTPRFDLEAAACDFRCWLRNHGRPAPRRCAANEET